METLLIVAIVLIALAIMAQAGVLIAMYLMSRQLAGKVESLMNDSKHVMAPLETVTCNLKTISEDLTATGKIARQRVLSTVEDGREMIMAPLRQYRAIGMGIAAGLRTFFFGRRRAEEPTAESEVIIVEGRQFPAA